jgi:ABC-type dipeptide/oligopeptide/nickel transport system ATPase subunit
MCVPRVRAAVEVGCGGADIRGASQTDYGEQLYLSTEVWERPWAQLSGGEMQRVGTWPGPSVRT